MSKNHDYQDKLAFVSRCLPGSLAEQQEKERLAEFHRRKALQKAEEKRNEPELRAQREEEYLKACQANKERMHKPRTVSPLRGGFRSS